MGRNVLGYVRVSTDEQADKGFSLQYQKQYITQHCGIKHDNLVEIYQDDCSAKNFNRPEYKKMKDFALKKSNGIKLILVTRWDRFARNLSQALVQIEKFKERGIEINSVEQHVDYDQPDYIVMLSMYLSTSQSERHKISLRVKEGNHKARLSGKYTNGHPPKGYYWKQHTNNETSQLLVNHAVAKLVKEAFNLYATGLYSAEEVRKQMKPKGLSMNKQPFLNMLRNRLYIGEVFVPALNHDKDQWVIGVHEAIIERELFDTVQELLDGKKRNHPKAKTKCVPELYLRNFLTCPVCGRNITGSFSKSRNGNRYPYYHCNHNGHIRINAVMANKCFVSLLSTFKPAEEVQNLFSLVIDDLQYTLKADIKKQTEDINNEIETLKGKINDTDDMLLGKSIDIDTHCRIITRHKNVISELESKRMLLMNSDAKAIQEKVSYSMTILEDIGWYFEKADVQSKIIIIGSIFPEKMQFFENEYRTNRINEVVEKMVMIPNELQKLEKEKASVSAGLSTLALPLGLEPRTL